MWGGPWNDFPKVCVFILQFIICNCISIYICTRNNCKDTTCTQQALKVHIGYSSAINLCYLGKCTNPEASQVFNLNQLQYVLSSLPQVKVLVVLRLKLWHICCLVFLFRLFFSPNWKSKKKKNDDVHNQQLSGSVRTTCSLHLECHSVRLLVLILGFSSGMPASERAVLQEQLIDIILDVLKRNPQLHYYQGYHDVAVSLLLVVGERMAIAMLDTLSNYHLRLLLSMKSHI